MTTDLEQSYKNKYRLYVHSYLHNTTPWYRSRLAQWVAIRRAELEAAGVTEERIEQLEDDVNRETELHAVALAEFLAVDEPPRREMFEGDTEPLSSELDTPLNYVFVPDWSEFDEGGK